MNLWSYIYCLLWSYLLSNIANINGAVAASIPEVIPHKNGNPVEAKLYAPDPPATHHVLMGIKYFDESLQKDQIAEVIIDVYGTVVPDTVKNFIKLCEGVTLTLKKYVTEDLPEHAMYKKSHITTVIKGDMIGGGQVVPKGSYTIYGPTMKDENFELKHDRPGRVSLMNHGVPDSNDSRFFFSMDPNEASKYDGRNVVFGQVVHGLDTLQRLQDNVAVDEEGTPIHEVIIEYVVVDTVTSEYFEKFHEEYLEKLERFKNGDTSVGVELQPSTSTMKHEIFELANLKLADMGHPLRRVLTGLTILCLIYILARYGKRMLNIRGVPGLQRIVSVRDR